MSRTLGSMVIVGVSLFSVAGRLATGYLGDTFDKRKLIAIAFMLQFVGTIVFALSTTTWHLFIFLAAWGFGFGASIPIRFALIADLFGRQHYGTVMGTMMTTSTIFSVMGPVIVGWIYDIRGNYREPFLLIACTVLVAIPLILTLQQPKNQDSN